MICIRWKLFENRYQGNPHYDNIRVFEGLRSVIGIVNLLLMILVFDSWNIYETISPEDWWFRFFAVLMYAHIIFWAALMPVICIGREIALECKRRNERNAAPVIQVVDEFYAD